MSEWSSRSIGSKLQHAIFYRLIAVGGRHAAYCLLFWVIVWYMCKPSVQRRSRPYLERRFPSAGPLARLRHRWRLQWEFGKVLVDRATAGITGRFTVSCPSEDAARLRSLHGEGKGLILLASHVGCWQAAMSALGEVMPVPASMVVYRDDLDHDRHAFEHRGETPPYSIIDPSTGAHGAVAMLQALQRGELLGIMGDRAFGDPLHTCSVPFLGGMIQLPYSAYHLASASGAPVVVFFSYRTGPGAARHSISAVIRVPERLGKQASAYQPFAHAYAAALEQSVRDMPYQFFNFYNMWGKESLCQSEKS